MARISSQSAPWRRKPSEAMRAPLGQDAGGGAAVSGDGGVVIVDAGEHGLHEVGLRRQAEPDVGALAHAFEHVGIAQELQVTGQARLGLAQDLG